MLVVEWSAAATAHMWEQHHVTPQEANEAVNDPEGGYEYPTQRSKSGQTGRWVGYCVIRGGVFVVTLLPDSTSTNADREGLPQYWFGVNAWPADATHRRIYKNREWQR